MKKIIRILIINSFLAYCSIANAVIVGPVNVLGQINDGSAPAQCGAIGLNINAGGVIEMALDLDQDGTVDVCFGSGSANCNAGFNFDAATYNGAILSTQNDAGGGNIMGGGRYHASILERSEHWPQLSGSIWFD